MKKKSVGLISILTTFIVCLSFSLSSSTANTQSSVYMNNIEALSESEHGYHCFGLGTLQCPSWPEKVKYYW